MVYHRKSVTAPLQAKYSLCKWLNPKHVAEARRLGTLFGRSFPITRL